MPKINTSLAAIALALAAFTVGSWNGSTTAVNAQSNGSSQVDVRPVDGQSSLIVYYPDLKKVFAYQNPFIGKCPRDPLRRH
ncbi:MAG: hypothetical protein WBW33_28145 [Bryobacteraceae bacterium]